MSNTSKPQDPMAAAYDFYRYYHDLVEHHYNSQKHLYNMQHNLTQQIDTFRQKQWQQWNQQRAKYQQHLMEHPEHHPSMQKLQLLGYKQQVRQKQMQLQQDHVSSKLAVARLKPLLSKPTKIAAQDVDPVLDLKSPPLKSPISNSPLQRKYPVLPGLNYHQDKEQIARLNSRQVPDGSVSTEPRQLDKERIAHEFNTMQSRTHQEFSKYAMLGFKD